MSDGYTMTGKDISLYLTIIKLYEQQQYMYENRVHSVEHRIPDIIDEVVKAKVKVFADDQISFATVKGKTYIIKNVSSL